MAETADTNAKTECECFFCRHPMNDEAANGYIIGWLVADTQRTNPDWGLLRVIRYIAQLYANAEAILDRVGARP